MAFEHHDSQRMEEEALAWQTRLDGGELTPAVRAELDAWLAADPAHGWRLARYRRLFAELHGTLPAMAAAGRLDPVEPPAPRRRRLGWAVAAAAVVALGILLWLQRPQVLETTVAQRQSVTLADGSRTDLNARTRLEVDLGRTSRRIRLEEGEALFTVTPDPSRPFIVETAAGSVRVTGTTFNVRTGAAGQLEVTVLEGRVAVRPVDADQRPAPAPRALAAGERLVYDPATSAVEVTRPPSVDDLVAWREGRVVFAGTPLREALARFADYHGREITVVPEAAELTLGGRYTLGDLDPFLAAVEQALPVRVLRRDGGAVRVVAVLQPR